MSSLQSAWEKSFTKRSYRIGLHVLFWLIYFIILACLNYYLLTMVGQTRKDAWNNILLGSLVNIPLICISYYLTIRTAYRFLIEKKKIFFSLISLVICCIIFAQLLYLASKGCLMLADALGVKLNLRGLSFQESMVKYGYKGIFTSAMAWIQIVISYLAFMSIPVIARFFRDQLRLQRRKNSLEQQNIKLEMDFLKAQIHPHFLFNTLNNIYSLIVHNENSKSAEMVSGLSSLLRYALYDGKEEFIPLEKEISMLRDFIALEEIRSDETDLELHFPAQIPDVRIPPFLLLSLVENAFKHGVNSQLKQSEVTINLQIDSQELSLLVHNTFDPDYRKKNSGGLGLSNLKKRLEYYYHNHYYFSTTEDNQLFTAQLKLPIVCPKSNA